MDKTRVFHRKKLELLNYKSHPYGTLNLNKYILQQTEMILQDVVQKVLQAYIKDKRKPMIKEVRLLSQSLDEFVFTLSRRLAKY